MPFARACASGRAVDDDAHLGVEDLRARVEVHRPDEAALAVDHHGLDVQPDKAAAHRRRVHQLGLDGGVGAQFVQRRPLCRIGRRQPS
jgi:hypothetical protein